MSAEVGMSEQEPLINETEARADGPTRSQVNSIYIYLALMLLSSVGQAMVKQANIDADYLAICRYAGISEQKCFMDPLASEYESVLVSYTDIFGGITGIIALLFASQFVGIFGMKPVVVSCILIGIVSSALYYLLLVVPPVHYLWVSVPSVLSTTSFYSLGQFLSSIYITERIEDANYRTIFLGWMTSVLTCCDIVGPALGAALLGITSTANLYLIATCIGSFGLVVTILFMVDSHHVSQSGMGIRAIIKLVSCSFIDDKERRLTARKIIAYVTIASVFNAILDVLQAIYVKAKFGWSAVENGWLSALGQIIALVSVAVISPIMLIKLSSKFPRYNHDFDGVDSFMCLIHVSLATIPTVLKAVFPYPKAFFAFDLLYKFRTVAQAVLISMGLKYAPKDAVSSFWVGMVYLVETVQVPSVLLAVNMYRHAVKLFPESLFWGKTAGMVVLFGIYWSLPYKL